MLFAYKRKNVTRFYVENKKEPKSKLKFHWKKYRNNMRLRVPH